MADKINKAIKSKLRAEVSFEKGIYTFVNPYSYLSLIDNDVDVSDFDGIYVDGILMVIFLRLVSRIKVKRLSFDMTSVAPLAFEHCIENGKSIVFVGASESEILEFKNKIASSYPELNILAYKDGYQDVLLDEFVEEIIALNPDFIIAGLGTPLQEKFLKRLKTSGWNGVGFTCGGFIRQYSVDKNFFPKWSNDLHLRWLVRLFREPHVMKRIVFQYPRFVFKYLRLNKIRA